MRVGFATGAFALCCAISSPALAQASDPPADQADDALSSLSIEELARIQVRSASKRSEPLSAAPAALYVITPDDIEALGLTSLPEALRLAPNLNVQRVDAGQYSISARGFNGIQAGNKVLALIDGRSIYTPLASSVFWNLHWPLLEDLQQIEVISGPGGTLYGPNAVNGVISVTTKDAQETLGTLVRGTAGALEQTAALRQGFAIGGAGAVRFYANWHHADGLPAGLGADIDDNESGWQAGFRSDFVTDRDHFTLQGDLFHINADTLPGDGANGHNVLARWSRTLSPTSSLQFQAYYDRFKREFANVDDSVSTIDAEGQFNATLGNHDLVAGAGARTTRDEFINNANPFALDPPRTRLWVYNGFIQDHMRLSEQLSLIAGVKVERSTFSGWQVLPNFRVAWQPNDRNLVWAAVSRAVRTPSRIDRQLEAPPFGPTLPPFLIQAPEFTSEKLVAVEAGYRGQPSSTTSISINGFVNFYDDLRTTELTESGSFQLRNGSEGTTYGIEAWGTAQIMPHWRASVGISTLWKDLHVKVGRIDFARRNTFGNDPKWQVIGRTEFDLTDRLQLALNARGVGRIEEEPEIDPYVEAGGDLTYRLTKAIDLFVAGRNLLHRAHLESNDPGASQLVRRSIYAGARARF
jgi:iron complex outermembrane receptor protein